MTLPQTVKLWLSFVSCSMRYGILIFLFFVLGFAAKADTLDFYRIKYKGNELKNHGLHAGAIDTFYLPLKNITGTDSISITYFRDTPCSDCTTVLAIDGEYGPAITQMGIGTGNPIVFSLVPLVHMGFSTKVYSVYYSEEGKNASHARILLCRIRIE